MTQPSNCLPFTGDDWTHKTKKMVEDSLSGNFPMICQVRKPCQFLECQSSISRKSLCFNQHLIVHRQNKHAIPFPHPQTTDVIGYLLPPAFQSALRPENNTKHGKNKLVKYVGKLRHGLRPKFLGLFY